MTTIDTATKRLLANPKKRHAWIIYQLLLKNLTMADLARETGVGRQTIYHVFKRPYPRMEQVVAKALGVTPQELFSERYDSDGLPLRRKGIGNGHGPGRNRGGKRHIGGNGTPKNGRRNAQVGEAA